MNNDYKIEIKSSLELNNIEDGAAMQWFRNLINVISKHASVDEATIIKVKKNDKENIKVIPLSGNINSV